MRRFQSVINRAEEIGANNENNRRVETLEISLSDLRERVVALELTRSSPDKP
jgi:hypothetical protein